MRLKAQIFLTLLLTGVILITLMYLISSWSFSRGFLDYINSSERARLTPMISVLGEGYAQEGNWDWIGNNGREWRALIDQHLMLRPPRPEKRRNPDRNPKRNPGPSSTRDTGIPDHRQRGDRGPRPPPGQNPDQRRGDNPAGQAPPLTLDPRLLLADADKQLIIGNSRPTARVTWQAITVDDTTVGFLGYRPRQQLTSRLDQLFEQQQKRSFAYAALATIILSALLSIPLAIRIVKPVLTINQAVGKISQGDYKYKLKLKRKDELGILATDINTLSYTLEQNQSSRQRWIAEISHELRTPVAVLQGELEAIEDGVRAFDQASAQSLQQEVLRLKRLINDLHDLSLSDLGALDYKMISLDFTELVQDFVNAHSAEAQSHSLQMRYIPGTTKTVIKGDLQRLTQLLQNLLQNTFRYTDANGHVEISVVAAQTQAVLIWSDSSPGVTEDQLEKLAEPLYRAESSRNRETGGAGLGLAIVSKIVAAHQGELQLEHSGLGGVSVQIAIPLASTLSQGRTNS